MPGKPPKSLIPLHTRTCLGPGLCCWLLCDAKMLTCLTLCFSKMRHSYWYKHCMVCQSRLGSELEHIFYMVTDYCIVMELIISARKTRLRALTSMIRHSQRTNCASFHYGITEILYNLYGRLSVNDYTCQYLDQFGSLQTLLLCVMCHLSQRRTMKDILQV